MTAAMMTRGELEDLVRQLARLGRTDGQIAATIGWSADDVRAVLARTTHSAH